MARDRKKIIVVNLLKRSTTKNQQINCATNGCCEQQQVRNSIPRSQKGSMRLSHENSPAPMPSREKRQGRCGKILIRQSVREESQFSLDSENPQMANGK
jgi:hypothetical protein